MYKNIVRNLSRVILMIIIITGLTIAIPKLLSITPLEIKSGSMSPKIKIGYLVYIKEEKYEDLKIGDIITYNKDGNNITHRIYEKKAGDIVCKGDNNRSPDPWLVNIQEIKGKVVFIIPYLGLVSSIIQNKYGLTVFVILIILCLWSFDYTTKAKKCET